MLPRRRVSAHEPIIETNPEADARLAETLARDYAIAFPDIFSDDVCAMLDRTLAQVRFVDEVGVSGPRLREVPMRTAIIVRALLNRPALSDWLAKIAGRGPLTDIRGSTGRF